MKKRMTIAVIALAVLLAGLIGLVVKLEHDRKALDQDSASTGSQASADATGENSQDPANTTTGTTGQANGTDPQGTQEVPDTTGAEQTQPSEIENETPFVTAPEQDDSAQPEETEPEDATRETGESSNELPFVPAG